MCVVWSTRGIINNDMNVRAKKGKFIYEKTMRYQRFDQGILNLWFRYHTVFR